jgi:hypothetical protein
MSMDLLPLLSSPHERGFGGGGGAVVTPAEQPVAKGSVQRPKEHTVPRALSALRCLQLAKTRQGGSTRVAHYWYSTIRGIVAGRNARARTRT